MGGGSTHTALLNRVESKAFRLINSPLLTGCILPLNLRRNNVSLSIFYRCFHDNCSSELANCMPPLLPRPRFTRLSSKVHPYTVQIPYTRVNQHLQPFIPVTGKLWNSFPLTLLPPTYDLNFLNGECQGISEFVINYVFYQSLTSFLWSGG